MGFNCYWWNYLYLQCGWYTVRLGMLTWLTPYRILTLWVHRCSPSNFITRHLSIGEILYRQASACRRDTLPTSICASEIYSTDKHLYIGETLYRQVFVCRWDTLPTSVTRHQLPDISCPTSVARHQLPVISYPTSVTRYQLPDIGDQ